MEINFQLTRQACQNKVYHHHHHHHLSVVEKVGEGTFGVCSRSKYGSLNVAIKQFKHQNKDEIAKEARILSTLRHPNLPLLVGVCFETIPFMVVTTFHSIGKGPSTTMHDALTRGLLGSSIRPHWINILHCIAMAIKYVHHHNIIHNDIKSNNIVIEEESNSFSGVLVDFGKATAANEGKTYPIFDGKEKKYYDEKYPHLAVELRNGGGTQTSSSDVYSFGYVMKLVSHTLKDRLLSTLYRSCRSVCPDDRPNISNVEQSISILR